MAEHSNKRGNLGEGHQNEKEIPPNSLNNQVWNVKPL
jgi:hypothetical protein